MKRVRKELSKSSSDLGPVSSRREQESQSTRFLAAFHDEKGLMLHMQTLLDALQTQRAQVLTDLDTLTRLCQTPTEQQLDEILQCCISPSDGQRRYSYALKQDPLESIYNFSLLLRLKSTSKSKQLFGLISFFFKGVFSVGRKIKCLLMKWSCSEGFK